MKLSRSALLLAFGATFVGAGLVVACGDDDSGTTTTGNDAGTATDTGSSTVADTGTGTTPDSGSTVDAGTDAGGDAGLKGYGQTCGTNADCTSDYCFISTGAGPNSAGTYCTIACTMTNAQDPTCANKTGLTGKCNMKGYCQPATH